MKIAPNGGVSKEGKAAINLSMSSDNNTGSKELAIGQFF